MHIKYINMILIEKNYFSKIINFYSKLIRKFLNFYSYLLIIEKKLLKIQFFTKNF
jgi:hypothetical protein